LGLHCKASNHDREEENKFFHRIEIEKWRDDSVCLIRFVIFYGWVHRVVSFEWLLLYVSGIVFILFCSNPACCRTTSPCFLQQAMG
jgi:hypothetical protein